MQYRHLLTGLVLATGAQLAQAQVLASDDFSTPGALTTNGWTAHSGAGNKLINSDGNVASFPFAGIPGGQQGGEE